jgi:phosphoglycerate kinase
VPWWSARIWANPAGVPDPAYSLAPVAARLGQLLGRPVAMAADTVGPSARSAAAALALGEVLMLENLRFNPGESSKDDAVRGAFADQLASLAELYALFYQLDPHMRPLTKGGRRLAG